MIKFIQKLIFLWQKKMHMTRIICERDYLMKTFGEIIRQDESEVRGRLAKLRAIKQPSQKIKEEAVNLEVEINKMTFYKKAFKNGNDTEKELKAIIKETKKRLFK